jgi:putative ABC transport system ATP-binding protein
VTAPSAATEAPKQNGPLVEARGVSRRFERGSDEVWAVRDVNIAVNRSEVLALVGRSGSGKTTLLNILAGLDRPTSGEVYFDGTRIDSMPERDLTELRRHKLGFVFQSFGLLPLLSAQENVELPLRISGFKHGERMRRSKHALELVGLTRRANHRPYELSGGEQQRVAIARALTCDPALILADEPTGELDSTTARAIFTLLRDLARGQGITVITCTHDRMVMDMADRVEELSDGKIVTGHNREVWEHVQALEHMAARSQQAEFLTPRIGDPTTIASNGHVAEAPPEEESDESVSRWAPPERRG